MEQPILPYDLEDDLWRATQDDGRSRVRVFSIPRPVVVLGRGSKTDLELNLEACEQDRVPLLRRRGGGCAVVLDPGNVIVAVSLAIEGIGDNQRHFDRLCRWMIEGIERAGAAGIYRDGISDLVLDDRKIGGSCIYRSKGVLLFSSSLLFSPDVKLIERYLAHPPREPEYRRGRRHRDFVGRLDTVVTGVSAPEFQARLTRELDLSLLR